MAPPLVALAVVLATAVGLWMSALNVRYRDIRYAMPFMIQLWMFATPIMSIQRAWSRSSGRWALALNPMAGLIAGFRAALFGLPQDWESLSIAAATTSVFFLYASFSFRHMERHFADVV